MMLFSLVSAQTVFLLILSNVLMTSSWHGHLGTLNDRPWYVAALLSWGIALVEYLLQVPANRIGFAVLNLPQHKTLQEVITLTIFMGFASLAMNQPLKLDSLGTALCMVGTVYFIFRS